MHKTRRGCGARADAAGQSPSLSIAASLRAARIAAAIKFMNFRFPSLDPPVGEEGLPVYGQFVIDCC